MIAGVTYFRQALNHLLTYILPPRCFGCANLIEDKNGFCGECWHKLNFIAAPYCQICSFEFSFALGEQMTCLSCLRQRPFYDYTRAVLKFDEHSRKIIHDLKYHDRNIIADSFAKIMANQFASKLQEVDLIVPVPMHKWRRLFRLYNHAQLIGSGVAKLVNKPIYNDIVIKTKNTRSQTSLSKQERQQNLRASIAINRLDIIKDKHVLLIDDVMTTGSTINYCAKLLKQAGAAVVGVVVIART